jgi:cytochrome c553
MHRAHRIAAGAFCAALATAFAAHAQQKAAPAAPAQGAPVSQPAAAPAARPAADAKSSEWAGVPVQNKIAQCQGCHGIPGWKTAFPEVYEVPKLGGQKAEYIVAALKEYRAGERDFATMRAIASQLTDADMEALAKYYGAPDAAAPTADKK